MDRSLQTINPQRLQQQHKQRLEIVRSPENLEALKSHLGRLHRGRERLIDSYSEGAIDKDQFMSRLSRTKDRMAELEAFISVHAQFPQNVVLDTKHDHNLNLANWEWEQCLTFPVSELNNLQFSLKPYKWIRYATGVVIGAQGELCTECNSPNPTPIDYNSELSAVSIDLFYHTTDQEKRHMFPIDPRLADQRTVTSSRTSTGRDNFRGDVGRRDGRCVLTGYPAYLCQAAHFLPHSKGDTV